MNNACSFIYRQAGEESSQTDFSHLTLLQKHIYLFSALDLHLVDDSCSFPVQLLIIIWRLTLKLFCPTVKSWPTSRGPNETSPNLIKNDLSRLEMTWDWITFHHIIAGLKKAGPRHTWSNMQRKRGASRSALKQRKLTGLPFGFIGWALSQQADKQHLHH